MIIMITLCLDIMYNVIYNKRNSERSKSTQSKGWAMESIEKQKIERLVINCKAELLNHTLQGEVLSSYIRKINSYLDECLEIVQSKWSEESTGGVIRRPRIEEEARGNILFFAYCMSKWDYQFVCAISGKDFNQGEALQFVAERIGVKANTLKNYRDTFDSHVKQMRSHRLGWKKPLTEEFVAIKEKYDSFNEDQLIEKGKELLQVK